MKAVCHITPGNLHGPEMNIEYYSSYAAMSSGGASILIEAIRSKPDMLLCVATGQSPLGLYQELVHASEHEKDLFRRIRIIKLDEWLGLGTHADGTCEQYLMANLINPLAIAENRYVSFDAETPDPPEECARMQLQLQKYGPIDLCVLGLGKNGHLGFNEPASYLQPHCHLAKLSHSSQQHNMVTGSANTPQYGMTLGMADILASRKIILLVTGEGKEKAKQNLLSGKVNTQCPASFLWLHRDVDCLIENEQTA